MIWNTQIRKHIRLKDYDYSRKGHILSPSAPKKRMQLFQNVGAAPCGPPQQTYRLAQRWLEKIPEKISHSFIESICDHAKPYSFDPIFLGRTDGGRPHGRPQQAYRLAQRWLEKIPEKYPHNFIG